MANMQKNTLMERAELARAYINGGSAPYQAERQTCFMNVTEMQEAIRALERKGAEDKALAENHRFGPEKTKPEKATEDPATAQTTWSEENTETMVDVYVHPEKTRTKKTGTDKDVIYPFLPPGQVAEEPAKRPLYALHTRELSVKRIGTSKPEVQIVLLENRYTLSFPVELLDKLISLLQAAKTLETD